MKQFDHLQITSRSIVECDVERRIEFIERGRHFSIDRHERLFDALSKRVKNRSQWMPICHVQCGPGMGASTVIAKLSKSLPEGFDAQKRVKNIPIIVTHLPVSGELQEFTYQINEVLGLPNYDYPLKNKLLNNCFDFLHQVSLDALIIDDFETLCYLKATERNRFLDVLRYATSRHGFQIILIGGQKSAEYVLENELLASRTEFASLGRFRKDDADFIALLDDFEAWCPLQFPSRISADHMLRKEIIYRSNDSLRSVIDLLSKVACYAIWNDFERINFDIWRNYVG